MKIKRGILYLSLWNQVFKKVGVNKIITRNEFFCILGKHYLIPKQVRPLIIKEMESIGLLKRENKENIRVLECDINIEDKNKIGELYRKVGLFTII